MTLALTVIDYIRELFVQKSDGNRVHLYGESLVEELLRKSAPQSKVAARLRLNVLCWCTSEACKYSIISAIVIAAAMTSYSSARLGIERFSNDFARKVYEQMVALIKTFKIC